ncbi:hypothetical protein PNK_0889 [Candidatus Protochlamydia naegleriophila]|uniref:NfeD-like C-terminal domain-containing protein n=1 Tax=Candidatus Protochlamydia naegleriophila TaxID=389348 RepID=A0A0U5JCZ4_9BACT|nr:NfeD family protein [Candidatus Protochlamydia naegleriophila]CUI16514.1 hypothetical protein PNK_0889 [Candidatus Protochlamydia naegleriophila]
MFKFPALLSIFFASLISFWGMVHSTESQTTKINLKGFLGKDELASAKETLTRLSEESKQTLVIVINSTSGDLIQMLDLAKSIYSLKKLKQLTVVVYLDDNVVGPAAMLPFLADEINTSLVASWGDIPSGAERVLPTNLLQNRVRSLIDSQSSDAPTLYLLADAMTDPSVRVIDNQGWKIAREKETNFPLISSGGQTLVVNQNQLKDLGIVKSIMPLGEFEKRYAIESKVDSKEGIVEEGKTTSSTSIEERLQRAIHFNKEGPNTVGYLYVGDHESSISQSTWLYIKQGLDHYKKNPPLFIILELNTPGGEVFAAQKISDALKEIDLQYNIPVVTFINNWAISAGAMLAYSTRFISVVKDGSMGAAEPVYAGEGGKMETASEKVNSALRADFASRARFFDRNPLIAEAMVDKDTILVWRHGKVVKLDNESQVRLTGADPDKVISPKGKLLTLEAEQMLEYGVADLLLPPQKLEVISPEEKAAGQWPVEKMLLFHTPYFSKIPQATVKPYQMDWKTHFFVLLATPIVSSLLFMGLMIGGYIELNSPGFGLPGAVAAACLFLIILSSFSLEVANWLELILLLTGLAIILVELFVLPTFGLLGIVGFILFIAGLFGMLIPGLSSVSFEYDTQTMNAAGQYVIQRLAWLCGAMLASAVIIALLAQYVLPSFAGFSRFVLIGREQEGFIAGENPIDLPQSGAIGKALTTLRPAGKIIVKDRIYEALSTGGFIEAGEPIIVARLEGSTIIVSLLTENELL